MKTLYVCCGLIGVLFLCQPAAAYVTSSNTCYSFCNGPYARYDLCAANCPGYTVVPDVPGPVIVRPQIELNVPWDDGWRRRHHHWHEHHYRHHHHGYPYRYHY